MLEHVSVSVVAASQTSWPILAFETLSGVVCRMHVVSRKPVDKESTWRWPLMVQSESATTLADLPGRRIRLLLTAFIVHVSSERSCAIEHVFMTRLSVAKDEQDNDAVTIEED